MLSRRGWIGRALGLAGLVGLTRRGRAAETPSKVSKEVAKYQDHPNNMQMCGMCKFYIPPGGRAGAGMMGGQMGPGMMGGGMMGGQMGPGLMGAGACGLVDGRISPMGWCVLYRPLSG
jgi:hypothetical protein